jgi:hypothetical protein
LDEGEIRFIAVGDGRGEGLGGFDVAVRNPQEVRRRAAHRGLVDSAGVILLSGTRLGLVAA